MQLRAGYASILLAAGKRTAAKVQTKKAIGIYKQTLGDDHPDTVAAATLMMSCSDIQVEST